MERSEEEQNESGSSQQHSTMWKQFQAKAKPLLSPKLGSRDPEDKKERSSWMFKKMKRKENVVLDRVISSSQPDLIFSSQVEEAQLCGKAAASGSSAGREKQQAHKSGSPLKSTVAHLVQSHHKSSSLGLRVWRGWLSSWRQQRQWKRSSEGGDAVTSAASAEAPLESREEQPGIGAPSSGVAADRSVLSSGMYKLEIELKRGNNLAVRDRGGTSDPYVKFKLAGKEVFRSKTIHKNLNPVWEEKTTLVLDCLSEPLYVKVFDYDFGLQDDFMGSAHLYLESLEQQRMIPVTLVLKDPHHPDQDLGSLELAVTLTPKDSPLEERRDSTTMLLRRSWKRSTKTWRAALPWQPCSILPSTEGFQRADQSEGEEGP
uniref:C2 domain-containing protein n=1 Tax=Labrus bergylta TaxID=56723 RepID=A0A3Q3GWX3_9LABR